MEYFIEISNDDNKMSTTIGDNTLSTFEYSITDSVALAAKVSTAEKAVTAASNAVTSANSATDKETAKKTESAAIATRDALKAEVEIVANWEKLEDISIYVTDFKITKQNYAPNSVWLSLKVEMPDDKGIITVRNEISEVLIDSNLSIQLISRDDDGKALETMPIVGGYNIINVKYKLQLSMLEIEVMAYSPDHYASLNTHSEAFVGKTIDEIIESSLSQFGSVKSVTPGVTYNTDGDPDGSNPTDKYLYSTAKSLHLHYYFLDKTEGGTVTRYGHRIPYAVQYNESTYSFLSRLAKRYGEFLFFENGVLHFGYQPSETKSDTTVINKSDATSTPTEVISISSDDIYDILFEDSTARASRVYVGNNHLDNNKGFPYNTNSGSDATSITATNVINDEVANNDSFVDLRKSIDVDAKSYADEEEYLSDSSNFDIVDGSLLTLYDSAHYVGGSIKAIGEVLNATSIASKVAAIALNLKTLTYDTWAEAVSLNTSYLEAISDSDGKLLNGVRYNDGPTAKALLRFTDNFAFVSYVKERSLDAKEQKITIELRNSYINKSLGLGSVISIADGTTSYYYVVYSMVVQYTDDSANFPSITLELIPYTRIYDGGVIPIFDSADLKREASTQTAIVVDTKDPYLLNRVRICYPWQLAKGYSFSLSKTTDLKSSDDLNTTYKSIASPWVRVATPAAKGSGGVIFTPDLYSEVLVDYDGGNIERPYVCASVYRDGDDPDYARDNEHTSVISSAYGQKIVFSDGMNGASFFSNLLGPIADLGLDFIPADGFGTAGESALAPFDGYTEITDKYSINSLKVSATDRTISITSSLGEVKIDALTGISIEAENGDISIKGKNISISAGNKLSLVSGTNIERAEKVSSTQISILNSISENAGLNFSLLRCVFESFFRPVGGNMVIKSNRFLSLEAGQGDAKISSFVRKNIFDDENEGLGGLEAKDVEQPLLRFIEIFGNIRAKLSSLEASKQEYKSLYEDAKDGYAAIRNEIGNSIDVDDLSSVVKELDKTLVDPNNIDTKEGESGFLCYFQKSDFPNYTNEQMEEINKIITNKVEPLYKILHKYQSALNTYKNEPGVAGNMLMYEIEQIEDPLRGVITDRLFSGEVPNPIKFVDSSYKDYAILRQAIYGNLAAKRVLLLALIQLTQESNTRVDFNMGNDVVVLNLPKSVKKLVDKVLTLDKIIPKLSYTDSTLAFLSKENKAAGYSFDIVCKVRLKDAKEITYGESIDVNTCWRYIKDGIFADEKMSKKEMFLEAVEWDGMLDQSLYFAQKGSDVDRQTLQDGAILFSDNRHITFRYDSRASEFVSSDASDDNIVITKIRRVLDSVEDDPIISSNPIM